MLLYYNEGVEDSISVGTLDLTDCIVLHNYPKETESCRLVQMISK